VFSSEETTMARGPGRRWQRGQSGNPASRPPLGLTLAEHLRVELERINGEDGLTTRAHELARVLVDLALTGDVAAIRTVLERVDGRVTEPIAVSGSAAPLVFTLRLGEQDDDSE
jgi:hypothetical protein